MDGTLIPHTTHTNNFAFDTMRLPLLSHIIQKKSMIHTNTRPIGRHYTSIPTTYTSKLSFSQKKIIQVQQMLIKKVRRIQSNVK